MKLSRKIFIIFLILIAFYGTSRSMQSYAAGSPVRFISQELPAPESPANFLSFMSVSPINRPSHEEIAAMPISSSPVTYRSHPEIYKFLSLTDRDESDIDIDELPIRPVKKNKQFVCPENQAKLNKKIIYLDLNAKDPNSDITFKELIRQHTAFVLAMVSYKTQDAEQLLVSFHDAHELNKTCCLTSAGKKIVSGKKVKNIYYFLFHPTKRDVFVEIGCDNKIEESPLIKYLLEAQADNDLYLQAGILCEFYEQLRDIDLAIYFYKAAEDSIIKNYCQYWIYRDTNPELAKTIHNKVMNKNNYERLYLFAINLITRHNGEWELTANGTQRRACNILIELCKAGFIDESDVKNCISKFISRPA